MARWRECALTTPKIPDLFFGSEKKIHEIRSALRICNDSGKFAVGWQKHAPTTRNCRLERSMAEEHDIALGVMQIAAAKPNRICTFDAARAGIPAYVTLTAENLAPSSTRPGEPMWHQL